MKKSEADLVAEIAKLLLLGIPSPSKADVFNAFKKAIVCVSEVNPETLGNVLATLVWQYNQKLTNHNWIQNPVMYSSYSWVCSKCRCRSKTGINNSIPCPVEAI